MSQLSLKEVKRNIRYVGIGASVLLLFVFAFWLYYASTHPVEPIVTTTSNGRITTPPIILPKPLPADASVSEIPEIDSETSESGINTEPSIPMFDATKPCPDKINACFGALANRVLDPTCPEFKPVWAYFTLDNGATWQHAGCYATEIDAEKALSKARKGLPIPAETALAKQTSPTDTTDGDKKSDKSKEKSIAKPTELNPAEHLLAPSIAHEPIQAKQELASAESHPDHKVIEVHPKYEATFTTGLGLFTVAKRAYPTEEMKNKAIAQWKKDMRILELDGTLNDEYAIKKPEVTPFPGMH